MFSTRVLSRRLCTVAASTCMMPRCTHKSTQDGALAMNFDGCFVNPAMPN